MEDLFALPPITQKDKTEHEKGCQFIRGVLTQLNLPVLPPHIVYCDSYHPDVSTRINNDKFVTFDYINTQGQFNFDLGGLFLLLAHKDILELAVAVIGEGVFPELVEKVCRHRSIFLEQLVIVPEKELESFLKEKTESSILWKPSDLK